MVQFSMSQWHSSSDHGDLVNGLFYYLPWSDFRCSAIKLSAPVINAGGTMKPKMNSQLNKDMDLRTNISFGDITDDWLPSGLRYDKMPKSDPPKVLATS